MVRYGAWRSKRDYNCGSHPLDHSFRPHEWSKTPCEFWVMDTRVHHHSHSRSGTVSSLVYPNHDGNSTAAFNGMDTWLHGGW